MPSHKHDHGETRTEGSGSRSRSNAVPVLIVLGDADRLGASRAVVRIADSIEIGRLPSAEPDAAWAIDDARASRTHARIEVDAGPEDAARITDLGSRNGTIVDG